MLVAALQFERAIFSPSARALWLKAARYALNGVGAFLVAVAHATFFTTATVLFMREMVDERPDERSRQQYHRQHRQPGDQPGDQPVLDESGCARIRIARDPGGNQTRQTGLDDAKSKMAMTAGNAKVHGNFPQRKGRASAAVCGALDMVGAQGHVGVPAVRRRSPSIRPNVAARSKSSSTCEACRAAVARGSPRQRYLMKAASPRASTTNAASSGRRKIARTNRTCGKIDPVDRRAGLRCLPDQIERIGQFDQRRTRWQSSRQAQQGILWPTGQVGGGQPRFQPSMEGDIQCPVETRNVGQVGQAMHVLLRGRETEGSALRIG